jgi:hypothetical protein
VGKPASKLELWSRRTGPTLHRLTRIGLDRHPELSRVPRRRPDWLATNAWTPMRTATIRTGGAEQADRKANRQLVQAHADIHAEERHTPHAGGQSWPGFGIVVTQHQEPSTRQDQRRRIVGQAT